MKVNYSYRNKHCGFPKKVLSSYIMINIQYFFFILNTFLTPNTFLISKQTSHFPPPSFSFFYHTYTKYTNTILSQRVSFVKVSMYERDHNWNISSVKEMKKIINWTQMIQKYLFIEKWREKISGPQIFF